jgi:hypothetical protein
VAEAAPLDEHFAALLSRVRPHEKTIRDFLHEGEAFGVIQIVRHFEPGREADEVLSPVLERSDGLEHVRGQHPLVGFHLGADITSFVSRVGIELDFDEYADEFE